MKHAYYNFMLLALLMTLSLFTFSAQAKQHTVIVSIETDIFERAQTVLAGKSPLTFSDFSHIESRRDVVEFILLQQALALGGSTLKFSFVKGNYDARNPKLLQQGLLLISFDSMWLSQAEKIKKDVYISDAIIRKGEYWAGIYTKNNKAKIKLKTLNDFHKLSVISSKHWPVDWETLQAMQPKELIHDDEWIGMAKLVSLGWIDVMLAPFTNKEPFVYQNKNYNIKAIDGVKVALNDSRHFLISRHHPLGEETFKAVQKGLKILRKKCTIIKAYQQSGFFNKKVSRWHVLNEDLIK
jgi:hypothetical protein